MSERLSSGASHNKALYKSLDYAYSYVKVVEDRPRPIMSAEYRLPLLAKTDPLCSAVFLR